MARLRKVKVSPWTGKASRLDVWKGEATAAETMAPFRHIKVDVSDETASKNVEDRRGQRPPTRESPYLGYSQREYSRANVRRAKKYEGMAEEVGLSMPRKRKSLLGTKYMPTRG